MSSDCRPTEPSGLERWAGRVRIAVVLAICISAMGQAAKSTQDGAEEEALSSRHRAWLLEVDVLLLDHEREAFAALERDYERDAFIRRFWQARDPDRSTQENEFRDAWALRLDEARRRYADLAEDRARTLLVFGPPTQTQPLLCLRALYPLEIWSYSPTPQAPRSYHFVFVNAPESGVDTPRLWSPDQGLGRLLNTRAGPGVEAVEVIRSVCANGGEILAWLTGAAVSGELTQELSLLPDPGKEWTLDFAARSTELAADAKPLPARLSVAYPARRGQRTAVQGLIQLAKEDAVAGSRKGQRTYSFLLDGRVLREDELFEDFRYRFDIPDDELPGSEIALVLERLLRPGDYRLILRVEDTRGGGAFRQELDLAVPRVENTAAPNRLPTDSSPPRQPERAAAVPEPRAAPFELLEEANRSLGSSLESDTEHRIRLRPPGRGLHLGVLRVIAEVAGDQVAKVRFLLDGRPVVSKSRPPYSVDLDLGDVPRVHLLEAVAINGEGRELARDRVTVNAGPHRFAVRLVEPRPGGRFRHSLRAHAEVEAPEGRRIDRVELYLGDTLLATLYQPPYVHPLLIPKLEEIAYLRAVAYLSDGLFAEDVVFLNAPAGLDRVEVDFVELFTSVVNRRRQPVLDLSQEELRVLEEGVPQAIRRFEKVTELPIHATVALDTSISMRSKIHAVETAARDFLVRLIGPKDRAAVVAFNDRAELLVPFTNGRETLISGLDGLSAEGETALFDAVVFGLFNLGGITGKRVLVLFSDGADTASEFDFETALEYARHSGAAIYTIALDVKTSDLRSRLHLEHLARETGGRSFFIDDLNELERVYSDIETELRSQYLVAYQSSAESGSEFRRVKVEIDRPGLTARTIPGYYP